MSDTITTTDASAGSERVQLSMQKAINQALADALDTDSRVLLFGEDVGALGGVFRMTDGLQARFGDDRVFDTPLAESGIIGLAVGLAIAGWRPVPEVQFDGFVFPGFDQLVSQVARMNYRSRGTMPMPITLRVPSFGGIRAPEHHGESLETYFAHVPGLKVVTPADPEQAYHLLRRAIEMPDPVVFMEPKSRYWNRSQVDTGASMMLEGARVVHEGTDATILTWGAMVSRSLQVAELAAEDGVSVEVLDLRWLSPLDEESIARAAAKTGRVVIVHEAPLTAGLGAEIATIVGERCFSALAAPIQRVTGFDVPTPSGDLEDEFIPGVDRILYGIQRVLEYSHG